MRTDLIGFDLVVIQKLIIKKFLFPLLKYISNLNYGWKWVTLSSAELSLEQQQIHMNKKFFNFIVNFTWQMINAELLMFERLVANKLFNGWVLNCRNLKFNLLVGEKLKFFKKLSRKCAPKLTLKNLFKIVCRSWVESHLVGRRTRTSLLFLVSFCFLTQFSLFLFIFFTKFYRRRHRL